jgi:hypothetical protein
LCPAPSRFIGVIGGVADKRSGRSFSGHEPSADRANTEEQGKSFRELQTLLEAPVGTGGRRNRHRCIGVCTRTFLSAGCVMIPASNGRSDLEPNPNAFLIRREMVFLAVLALIRSCEWATPKTKPSAPPTPLVFRYAESAFMLAAEHKTGGEAKQHRSDSINQPNAEFADRSTCMRKPSCRRRQGGQGGRESDILFCRYQYLGVLYFP